jgi:hypothetical protein
MMKTHIKTISDLRKGSVTGNSEITRHLRKLELPPPLLFITPHRLCTRLYNVSAHVCDGICISFYTTHTE